jgi:hypothetical protein
MLSLLLAANLAFAADLPTGPPRAPVAVPHFPDRLHAYVWRNWELVPVADLAEIVGARPRDIVRMGRAMGLSGPPRVTRADVRRASTTIIKRNWHILPYEQLLALLGWTTDEMAYHLREDDFLFVKLGHVKPQCEGLRYAPPDAAARERERAIAAIVREVFSEGVGRPPDPPFGFVARLSRKPPPPLRGPKPRYAFEPRYCFSYFGLTGDPLLDSSEAGYPDGLLARLAATGVDGVWLQAVLYRLAPFPWDSTVSAGYRKRLAGLAALVARAKRHGIGVYLYLNEPRAMPLGFFDRHPDLKGVVEGDYAALCTSVPAAQRFIVDSVASVCRAVPDLAGFFSITASENLTNCYSHSGGADCPRCGKRSPEEVIAEVNDLFRQGIREAGTRTHLIVWDWGWRGAWAEGIIRRLPDDVALMSVSEWSIPLQRGGVDAITGEYSISVIGPGPRATRHWELARQRGLKTLAKIQAGNTWELSAVPYIPAVENVARHIANLRRTPVSGLMLGWTLGGYPSPNLEVVAEMSRLPSGDEPPSPDEALMAVALRRFGRALGPAVAQAWREFSAAFSEFPYDGGLLYSAPMQLGPANPLWEQPTGYGATMVGFPYDDLDAWRAVYPPEVFIGQFGKVAEGFEQGIARLRQASRVAAASQAQRRALAEEVDVAEVCAVHFRSTANQARFVLARRALAGVTQAAEAGPALGELAKVLEDEEKLATRLWRIQVRDSRFGFEASNQYYYVPVDLAEKVLNCRDLRDRWLPAERAKWGLEAQ